MEVEKLEGATGALSFDGDVGGAVLLQSGRVCWAVGAPSAGRLTELFCEGRGSSIERNALEDLYRRCRREKSALTSALLGEGVLSAEGLRAALLQHSAEGVASLAQSGVPAHRGVFRPHRRSYEARFTFSTAELLAAAGALSNSELARAARELLSDVGPSCDLAAAFVAMERATTPYPIAQQAAESVTASELVELGRFARSALDITRGLCGSAGFVTVGSPRFGSVVAWSARELMIVACGDKAAAARALSRWRSAAEQ